MSAQPKLVIPGGSGFLGRILATWFVDRGWAVTVLSRRPTMLAPNVRMCVWDGESLGDWASELDGAEAVVNLAGRSVNCRYNRRNRRDILQSRTLSTRVIGEAIAGCAVPPPVWLNSSTATIYKHSLDRPMDELTGEIGATPEACDAFSIDVATAWERALDEAATPNTRKLKLRTAIVLEPARGGFVDVLHRLTRFGLGGTMGRGDQFVSWIHGNDYCRAIEWLIDHREFGGTVNLAAPNPLPNRDLMQTLRLLCKMPFGLPATRWMLEVGACLLRTETELIVKSRRVVPRKLLDSGFSFQFPELKGALADILRRRVDSLASAAGAELRCPSPQR